MLEQKRIKKVLKNVSDKILTFHVQRAYKIHGFLDLTFKLNTKNLNNSKADVADQYKGDSQTIS